MYTEWTFVRSRTVFLHEEDADHSEINIDYYYTDEKDSFYKFSVIKMIFFMREVTQ